MDTIEQQPAGEPEPVEDAETRGEPDVEPSAEPDADPTDTHTGPLDDDEDARHLRPEDPRRQEVEQRRGERFSDQPDDEGAESDAAEDEGEAAESSGSTGTEQSADVDDGEGDGEQEAG